MRRLGFPLRFRLTAAIFAFVTVSDVAHPQGNPRPISRLRATWIGQDGTDKVGPTPKVGPSDVQDIHIVLDGLPVNRVLARLEVSGQGGDLWRFGEPAGPFLCALERQEGSPKADLFVEPSRVEQGRPFEIKILYDNGETASVELRGGKADPSRRVPEASLRAVWIGANGTDLVGASRAPGPDGRPDAVIEFSGLSRRTPVRSVVITEPAGRAWSLGPTKLKTHRAELINSSEPGKAWLHIQPETSIGRRALRVIMTYATEYEDRAFVETASYDPGVVPLIKLANPTLPPVRNERASLPKTDLKLLKARYVSPGESLRELVLQHDHIQLKSGDYVLDEPLILQKPVVLEGEPGTTLIFRQPPESDPWTSAIEIRASRIHLKGLAIRCQGPIRWNVSVSYGPALIGGPVNGDDRPGAHELEGLDLLAPAASGTAWPEALRLARLVKVDGGSIRDCLLQGGMIEFASGPWVISDNRHRGSAEGTQTGAAFSGHDTDHLILQGNQVEPLGSGRLWRFLVLTGRGEEIQIVDNRVKGVGPARTDPIPHPNAPEVILTESYRVDYEGMIAGLSSDGLALAIHQPQRPPISVGAVVALLDGPAAGLWRRVVRVDGPTKFLVDRPIPTETRCVSVTSGFVGMTITGNTIDCRGRDLASPLVLVGNHFGTRIEGNTILGGAEAFRLSAAPTEEPIRWGWTHAPFLGVRLIDNQFTNCARGGSITVDHSDAVEPGAGRVYFSLESRRNRISWLEPSSKAREALRVGDGGGLDPGELRYFDRENSALSQNRVDVRNATVNGVSVPSGTFSWPLAKKAGGL